MFKEPITDMGKKSKKGRLTLEHDNGQWSTTQEGTGNPDKVCVYVCSVSPTLIFVFCCTVFIFSVSVCTVQCECLSGVFRFFCQSFQTVEYEVNSDVVSPRAT